MIAFYLPFGSKADSVDLTALNRGNPGVGGTQYLFLLTVSRLNVRYGSGSAVLYSDRLFAVGSEDVPTSTVGGLEEAILLARAQQVDYLVVNGRLLTVENLSILSKSRVPLVAWAHNTVGPTAARIASSCPSIARIVCVSEAQWESMRDSICFPKCTFINNGLAEGYLTAGIVSDYSRPEAVYVGSLYPQKGVHNLLRIWRKVNSEVPEATLKIIGGAQIWGSSEVRVGPMGVADPHYERVLRKELSRVRDQGSVAFLGVKSWNEIDECVAHARVGVANPSHYLRDETFCMAALELQSRGLAIVSRFRNDGLATSVSSGTSGYLEVRDHSIARRLVDLLRDGEQARSLGANAVEYSQRFCVDSELYKWVQLLDLPVTELDGPAKRLFSKDALLLMHDWILKMWFYLSSGKLGARIFSRFMSGVRRDGDTQ